MVQYYLTVENALDEEKIFHLEDRLTIGRTTDNDIKLLDPIVSRQHAVVYIKNGQPFLEDQGSTNGTYLNGEKIGKETLSNGDKLRMGRAYLRFFEGEHPPARLDETATMVSTGSNQALSANLGEMSLHQLSPDDLEHLKTLELELEKGQRIQRNFLPDRVPVLSDWEIATCFQPARQVAGDFYDFFMLPGDYLGLVIGDVCDKGVGSALFMSMIRSLIRIFSGETQLNGLSISGTDDQEVDHVIESHGAADRGQVNALSAIALTNDYIAQEHGKMCMFATLFFGVLNPATGLFAYINGGHEPLYIIGPNGIEQTLDPTGPAVGMLPHMKFDVGEVRLNPGETVIGYSDGVTEANAPNGDMYTRKRLISLLAQSASSASRLLERVENDLFLHIGDGKPFDDITMIALRRTP